MGGWTVRRVARQRMQLSDGAEACTLQKKHAQLRPWALLPAWARMPAALAWPSLLCPRTASRQLSMHRGGLMTFKSTSAGRHRLLAERVCLSR